MRLMNVITLIALLCAGAAIAQDRIPSQPNEVDQSTTPQPITMGETGAVTTIDGEAATTASSALRPAMMEELRRAREQESAEVAELAAELETATADERLTLQRRISEIKGDAMVQSMTIQLEYARLGGHEELAQRLEADIEQFEMRRDAPRGTINTETVRERPARGGQSR